MKTKIPPFNGIVKIKIHVLFIGLLSLFCIYTKAYAQAITMSGSPCVGNYVSFMYTPPPNSNYTAPELTISGSPNNYGPVGYATNSCSVAFLQPGNYTVTPVVWEPNALNNGIIPIQPPVGGMLITIYALPGNITAQVASTGTNSTTICSGGSATLTASGAAQYEWSPAVDMLGGNGSKVIVTPNGTTTYTVTGSNSNNTSCFSNTVRITVNVSTTAPACLVPSPPTGTSGNTLSVIRNAAPITLTGSQLPLLNLYLATDLVGFAYIGGNGSHWKQIPIQVDEKKLIDAGTIYNTSTYYDNFSHDIYPNNPNYSSFSSHQYCDPNTWVGYDTDPTFDADDELSFMARDAGIIASGTTLPAGVNAGTGVQITITDPLNPSEPVYVYIFQRASSSLDPGAGVTYLHYFFKLNSGNYKTSYNLGGFFNTQLPPFNPESSTITSKTYTEGFGDRWLENSLEITTTGSNGANILDRHRTYAGDGIDEGEDTFDYDEGAYIANISGPVRAIRSFMGAASGPLTQRDYIFYDQLDEAHTFLRVHDIPQLMDYNNYIPAAGPMLYNNNNNSSGGVSYDGLQGTEIDGHPDNITTGQLEWELINSSGGSVFRAYQPVYDFVNRSMLIQSSYYVDDNSTNPPPSDVQVPEYNELTNQANNAVPAWGASGYFINQTLLNIPGYGQDLPFSDPRNTDTTALLSGPNNTQYMQYLTFPNDVNHPSTHPKFNQLELYDYNIYLPADFPRTEVSAIIGSLTSPLTTTAVAWPPQSPNNLQRRQTDTLQAPTINFYPNPNSGIVTINVSGNTGDKITAEFYDSKGKKIYTAQSTGSLNQQVDLHAGIGIGQLFLARVYVNSKLYTQKILVNK